MLACPSVQIMTYKQKYRAEQDLKKENKLKES